MNLLAAFEFSNSYALPCLTAWRWIHSLTQLIYCTFYPKVLHAYLYPSKLLLNEWPGSISQGFFY